MISKPTYGAILLFAFLFPTVPGEAEAAKYENAKVSKVVNDVKLLLDGGTSRPAKPGDVIRGRTAVQTGRKSRAELRFPDESIARLGSSSVFSFSADGDMDLSEGTMLLHAPKKNGKTRIKTAAVTAAITGTTILIEYVPPVFDQDGRMVSPGMIKIIVIEGTLEFYWNKRPWLKRKLRAGQMVVFHADGGRLPKAFMVDLDELVATSLLLNGGFGPLPWLEKIEEAIAAQQEPEGGGGPDVDPRGRPGRIQSDVHNARLSVNGAPPPPTIIERIFRPRPKKKKKKPRPTIIVTQPPVCPPTTKGATGNPVCPPTGAS